MEEQRFRSEEHTSELQSLRHLVCRLPPRWTLFPYTTLFRSRLPPIPPARALPCPGITLLALTTGFTWRNKGSDRKSTRLNSSHLGISYAVFHLDGHSFPTRRSSDLGSLRYHQLEPYPAQESHY